MAGKGVHHEFQGSAGHEVPEGSSNRAFGLVFAGFFALLAGWSLWRGGQSWPWWLGASAAMAVLALALPALLTVPNRLWMRFGMLLAAVINPIVLAVLYFVVFTPIGLLARLFGKDFLRQRAAPQAHSYWIRREPPGPAPSSMRDQF